MSTVMYRVRLMIDDEEQGVELHRTARGAASEAVMWARRFPDARVEFEVIDVCSDDGEGLS